MPTKRRRKTRGFHAPVSDAILYLLAHGTAPPRGECATWFDAFLLEGDHARGERQRVWDTVKADLLAAWLAAHPGTRPAAWWDHDAPPEPIVGVKAARTAGDVAPQRRRLGGVGTPAYAVLNSAPDFDRGIPTEWVDSWSVEYYNGRARDIHGERIGVAYHEGDFAGVAPDPHDPPIFESEAAYLDRYGLLSDAERRRVPAAAFEPEAAGLDEPDDDTAA